MRSAQPSSVNMTVSAAPSSLERDFLTSSVVFGVTQLYPMWFHAPRSPLNAALLDFLDRFVLLHFCIEAHEHILVALRVQGCKDQAFLDAQVVAGAVLNEVDCAHVDCDSRSCAFGFVFPRKFWLGGVRS